VAAEVEGLELDLADAELLRRGVLRRLVLHQPLVLEHVEQRGLAGVVEAEEEDLGLLLPEAERGQHPVEPVPQEHLAPLGARRASRPSTPVPRSRLPGEGGWRGMAGIWGLVVVVVGEETEEDADVWI